MNVLAIALFALLVIVSVPYGLYRYKIYKVEKRRATIEKLCRMLFPSDKTGEMLRSVIENMTELTKGRFSYEELLDYYLKIKGLQLIDINLLSDPDVNAYLMEPTKIRLQYFELVSFYETYFNQTQARGLNAEGRY